MKAFLVGVIVLIAVTVMAGIGYLILPFLLVLGLVIKLVLAIVLVILAIWFLGKFVIFIWETLRQKEVK